MFRIIMRMLDSILPLTFAFSFYVCGYIMRENDLLSAGFMLIGTVWMVVSKLDDILQRIGDRKLIVEVNNPPGLTSRVEVNGKPVN